MSYPSDRLPAPISIRITARKARVVTGEGILLDIHHHVSADLDMETVEMNRDRTRLMIERIDIATTETLVLTGLNAARLHRRSPLEQIGRRMHSPAGSTWSSYLELFEYCRPLPAGRYRIGLTYRYGHSKNEVADAGVVEMEIVPIERRSIELRWFGQADSRDELGGLWQGELSGATHWYYQVSSKFDPGVLLSCADLDIEQSIQPLAPPRLALLNDLAGFHFDRCAVWMDAAGMGWLQLSAFGRSGNRHLVPHQLMAEPTPILADPPLQTRDGRLMAIAMGLGANGKAAGVLIEANGETASTRMFDLNCALPRSAVVYWDPEERSSGSRIYWIERRDGSGSNAIIQGDVDGKHELIYETKQQILGLQVDQWSTVARLTAVIDEQGTIVTLGSDLAARPRFLQLGRYDLSVPTSDLEDLIEIASSPEPGGVAGLFERENGWWIISPTVQATVDFDHVPRSARPRLVYSRAGLFLLSVDPFRGYLATRVDPGEGALP